MGTKNSSRFTPVIIAVSVVIGILIGTFYAHLPATVWVSFGSSQAKRFVAHCRRSICRHRKHGRFGRKAMPQILAELDPHSTYIPAQNLEESQL